MFSSIFSFLALSYSLNDRSGRLLTLFTIAVSTLAMLVTVFLLLTGLPIDNASGPSIAGAFLMLLRSCAVTILPPRGEQSGLREALCSFGLATMSGVGWYVVDPVAWPAVFAAVLLLSWPHLADGINAFADRVFYRAAQEAGAHSLAPGALTAIGRATDIVIDKAAVMSGPDLMVSNVMAFDNEPKTLLAVAASAEANSTEPVAIALRQLAAQWRVNIKTPDRFEPAPGLGVIALLGGQTVVIGTTSLLKRLKIDSFTADAIARALEADGKTVLRVAVAGRVVGVLGLEGTLRQDAGVAGRALRKEGLTPWLFTHDSQNTRQTLADMLGLENPGETEPGETARDAAARRFGEAAPLVLMLSKDRNTLELHKSSKTDASGSAEDLQPIAVSATDDIGAFPALKALATRRNLLTVSARRMLTGVWLGAGLCATAQLLPLMSAPLVFTGCLGILLMFARFAVSGNLASHFGRQESHMLRPV
ncbi:HAD family hydrolase [uncultured Roseibium sp.]|uniref:HAD family hydrolase n=1 Tax=uncultured Roseibium sp. TaxID=1936171 RepID=UPI00261914C8|nr:HAD family hydrolase [uncultured Roseibium sp.]